MRSPSSSPDSATRRRKLREAVPCYLGIAPYYILYVCFSATPVVFTAYLAFHKWDGFSLADIEFVGLDNFAYLIHDSVFWHSVANTFILWFMSTVPTLILAMCVALMLHANIRYSTTFKVMYFLPNITSIVAMGVLFGSIFSSRFGLLNGFLHVFGIDQIPWMQTEWGTKIAIASLSVWAWVGYNALIYLAGLQSVPVEHYEAAKLDGASTWQTFRYVTLPSIQPIVLFTVVMSTIGGMQSFTEAQVMTSGNAANSLSAGGVGQSGLTMVLYFWAVAFKDNNYGYGAAIAWAVFIIVMIFTIINWRLTKHKGAR
ncbi:MAG: sugar ABC transporter permease [Actinomycetaceae bacterium]|nr:sugar ABC transporter permease [Actinomycetaceae bacterium]